MRKEHKIKFEEALVHLKSGRKIRRKGWEDEHYLLYIGKMCYASDHRVPIEVEINPENIMAEDWEITEEPKKLYAWKEIESGQIKFYEENGVVVTSGPSKRVPEWDIEKQR